MELTFSTIMIFVAVTSALFGLGSLVSDLWTKDRDRAAARVSSELRSSHRKQVESSALFKDFRKLSEAAGKQEQQKTFQERLELWLEQSGLSWTVQQFMLYIMAGAGGLGMLGLVARRSWLVALVGALIGLVIPILFVRRKRNQRREKFQSQLTDAFEVIARAMRSGQSLNQGINMVATECQRPIADEFSLCFEQQKLGLPADVAFNDLAHRVGLLEMRLFALSAQVQQRTGSNMAELVEQLAGMVRERYRTKQKIQTLTAESRLQANVLLGLPFVIFFIMLAIKRDYAQALLDNPSLLGATFIFQMLGMLWIRKIVRLDD